MSPDTDLQELWAVQRRPRRLFSQLMVAVAVCLEGAVDLLCEMVPGCFYCVYAIKDSGSVALLLRCCCTALCQNGNRALLLLPPRVPGALSELSAPPGPPLQRAGPSLGPSARALRVANASSRLLCFLGCRERRPWGVLLILLPLRLSWPLFGASDRLMVSRVS